MVKIFQTFRRFWAWLKTVDLIGSVLDWSGLGKIIVGSAGRLGLGVWGLVDQLPGSVVALMVLVGGVGAIWAVNGIQWWRTASSPGVSFSPTATLQAPPAQSQTLPPQSGPYLRGLTIRLADLARDDTFIRDRTFEDCHLYGPAMLLLSGVGILAGCHFDATPEAICITISEARYLNVIIEM